MKLIIDINNNTQFRNLLDKLNDETDKNVRLGFDCLVYVKMTKLDYKQLIHEDIPGNHDKDYSQFFTQLSSKFPNMRYVAIGRTKKAYRDDKILTGGYEPLKPWRFWRWADHFGLDNLVAFIPQAEVIE